MATKTQRAAETSRYVLVTDRELPPEQQSTWILRPMTQIERAEAQDNLVRIHAQPDGSSVTVPRNHRLSLDLCLSNIERVENFPAGEAQPWPEGRAERIAYLDQLDDAFVQEIGNEIWLRSTAGPAAKN